MKVIYVPNVVPLQFDNQWIINYQKMTAYNLAKTLKKFAIYPPELSDEEWEELGIPRSW